MVSMAPAAEAWGWIVGSMLGGGIAFTWGWRARGRRQPPKPDGTITCVIQACPECGTPVLCKLGRDVVTGCVDHRY